MSESMINVFQPFVGQEERQIIGEVFETNWLGKGRFVNEFKTEFAKHLNTEPRRLASTTCGTEAIFLAAELFEFNSNDEIIVPSISFVAVGSSVVAKQAHLVLCDVDRRTLNVTAHNIERKITKKTKAVILTHYGGMPCDMETILDLCKTHHIKVIEDSACAMKALYKGQACGTFGDMGIWSFEAGKIITTGDGGMVYLKSDDLVKDAEEYLYLGLGNNEKSGIDRSTAGSDNWWEIQIERPGRRAIMNNLAGAIGLAQLKKIDSFIARRKAIDERYRHELAGLSWLRLSPSPGKHCEPSYQFFWIQLDKRDELAIFLRNNKVYSTFRYWPLHKIRHFHQKGTGLSNAEFASQHTLNLPLHPALTDDDVTKVIGLIKAFGRKL